MDRCEISGCREYAQFLIASAAHHVKTCGGCVQYGMRQHDTVSAFIIDLRRVYG